MGEFSITHWLILGLVFFLFFGAKRIPEVGASLGKGLREFKRSLSDINDSVHDTETPPAPPRAALPPASGSTQYDNHPPKRLVE